jgi:hypothetical protein
MRSATRHLLYICALTLVTLSTSGCCTMLNGTRWLFGCVEAVAPNESEIAKKFPLDTPTSTFEAFKFSVRINNATLCHRYILAGEIRDSVAFADFAIGWDEKIQAYKQVALEAWIERVERVGLAGKDGKRDGRNAAIVHCISRDGRRERFLIVEEQSLEPSNAFWLVGPGGDANAIATSGGMDSPMGEIETDSPFGDDEPAASPTATGTEAAVEAEAAKPEIELLMFTRWRMIFPSQFQRDSTWFPEIAEMIREADAQTLPPDGGDDAPPADGAETDGLQAPPADSGAASSPTRE